MILDSKGKLFGKVSIVDALIFLVVVGAIIGVGYKMSTSKVVGGYTKTDKIEIVFYNEDIPDFVAKAIKVGDLVKDFDRNNTFGKVTKIELDKSILWTSDDKGVLVKTERPGDVSIKLTVEGVGIYRDSTKYAGATFGSSDYFVGRTVQLLAGKSGLSAKPYEIKKKG